jgi:hypothetical protein
MRTRKNHKQISNRKRRKLGKRTQFKGIGFWTKIALFFRKPIVGYDEGGDGWTVKTVAKKLGGQIYILSQERFIAPPEHPNCRCEMVAL